MRVWKERNNIRVAMCITKDYPESGNVYRVLDTIPKFEVSFTILD